MARKSPPSNTVNHVSGGADLAADQIDINGNVVGRDNVQNIQAGTYIAPGTTTIIQNKTSRAGMCAVLGFVALVVTALAVIGLIIVFAQSSQTSNRNNGPVNQPTPSASPTTSSGFAVETQSAPPTALPVFTPEPMVPDFTVAGQTTGTAPFNVQFVDQSQGAPSNWWWNFGDGQTVEGKSNAGDTRSLIYTYEKSSYRYNTPGACFVPGKFTVSLAFVAPQPATAVKENLISVQPEEHTLTLYAEPTLLKDYAGVIHNPGCSSACGIDLKTGATAPSTCLTSVPSKRNDRIGYYFAGQQIGLQVDGQVTFCPSGTSDQFAGIYEFSGWAVSPPLPSGPPDDQLLTVPAGNHQIIIFMDKQDLTVIAHYTKVRNCN